MAATESHSSFLFNLALYLYLGDWNSISTTSQMLGLYVIYIVGHRRNIHRSLRSSGQPIYSGVYATSILPAGKTCIKTVFPLPNGNATVLMTPSVGQNGELILESSGKKYGDAGFYFLLKDAKGEYWTQYTKSFRDQLILRSTNGILSAEQVLTLWKKEVLRFNYKIERKQ